MFRLAKEKNLTLRQLYQETLIANNHHVVIGTPAMIADAMEEWFVDDAADGFNIVPAFTPISLRDFVDHVSPELRRRGLVRTRYEASTLRENMGFAPAPHSALRTLQPEG
jgi:alkanesulfonate monooxygenase SsuD/methylene tetrahydromethanopterin reductase-like flavin-dependent oxidoreductase (luciferase family)